MTISIGAIPGQAILLAVEILDNTGTRVDGYAPTLDFVKRPNGYNLAGSTAMTRMNVGLYKVSVSVPSGITAIGTYIASVSWVHPDTAATQYELFLINVALAYGTINAIPV